VKLSEAFREAKTLMHSERNGGFICLALEDLAVDDRVTAKEAALIVQARIRGYYTANEYVARTEYGYEGKTGVALETFLRVNGVNMTKWREDFLDRLIYEYEAKGQ
jgi:hypothetical protein